MSLTGHGFDQLGVDVDVERHLLLKVPGWVQQDDEFDSPIWYNDPSSAQALCVGGVSYSKVGWHGLPCWNIS